jgi:hypothetical protein
VSDTYITVQNSQPQYVVGILAIMLALAYFFAAMLFRLYSNQGFIVDQKLQTLAFVIWCIIVGFGGLVYGLTKSVIVISLTCYMPPVIYLAVYSYMEWIKRDYCMIHIIRHCSQTYIIHPSLCRCRQCCLANRYLAPTGAIIRINRTSRSSSSS